MTTHETDTIVAKISKDDVCLAIVSLLMSQGMQIYDVKNISCHIETLAGTDGKWGGEIMVRISSKNGKPIGTVQVASSTPAQDPS